MLIINTTNTYPKYKSSKIESVGEIPEGWEEKRFCFLFSFNKGLSITKENLQDEGVPCISYGEIHSIYGFEVNPDFDELKCVDEVFLETSKSSLLKYGDFVFADTSEDIKGSGNFTYLNGNKTAFAGYHTIIAKPKSISYYRYIAYLFDSLPFRAQIRSEVAGVKVYSITKTILKNCIVILPSIPEQVAITNFLDRETARINEIVERQKRLIDLLKEKRNALVTHAITKGINQNSKMKKSNINWMVEISDSWESYKIKFTLSNVIGGGTPNTGTPSYWNGDIPWVSPKDMKVDFIRETEDYITNTAIKESAVNLIPSNSVLCVFRSGILKHTFPVAINKVEVTLNQDMKALIPNKLISSEYLRYMLTGLNDVILNICVKAVATVESVEAKYFFNLFVPIPPASEQVAIVDFLNREISTIDTLVNKIECQIELLEEYKQSLITSAVTGKIDVRGASNA